MSFYPSFILSQYSFKEIYSSPDLEVWYLKNSDNLALLVVSSWIPNFKFLPNYSKNFLESSAFSIISPNNSIHFLTMFFLITFKILLCYKNSLEIFNGKSSESTTPLTKPNHSGIKSSQSSIMKTLLTYNLMLFFFFLVSNISNGALFGTNKTHLNSN